MTGSSLLVDSLSRANSKPIPEYIYVFFAAHDKLVRLLSSSFNLSTMLVDRLHNQNKTSLKELEQLPGTLIMIKAIVHVLELIYDQYYCFIPSICNSNSTWVEDGPKFLFISKSFNAMAVVPLKPTR